MGNYKMSESDQNSEENEVFCTECNNLLPTELIELYSDGKKAFCEICGSRIFNILPINTKSQNKLPEKPKIKSSEPLKPLKSQLKPIFNINDFENQLNRWKSWKDEQKEKIKKERAELKEKSRIELEKQKEKFQSERNQQKEQQKIVHENIKNRAEKERTHWEEQRKLMRQQQEKRREEMRARQQKNKEDWEKFWNDVANTWKSFWKNLAKAWRDFWKEISDSLTGKKSKVQQTGGLYYTQKKEIKTEAQNRSPRVNTNKNKLKKPIEINRSTYISPQARFNPVTGDPIVANAANVTDPQPSQPIVQTNFDTKTGKFPVQIPQREDFIQSTRPVPRFDPRTGKPLVTIQQGEKKIEKIKPIPQFDPKTGKRLQPISQKSESKDTKKQEKNEKSIKKSQKLNKIKIPEKENTSENKKFPPLNLEAPKYQKVFTVLDEDVRFRLINLPISEEKKDILANSLLYLNDSLQMQYLEEYEKINDKTRNEIKKFIEQIKNSTIPIVQQNSLISQFNHLPYNLHDDFIEFIQEGNELSKLNESRDEKTTINKITKKTTVKKQKKTKKSTIKKKTSIKKSSKKTKIKVE